MPDAIRLPALNASAARFAVTADASLWRGIEQALDNLYALVFVTDASGKLLG